MSKSVKFTNFNVDNFQAYLKSINVGATTYCIDLSPDLVYSKVFPVDKRWVNYVAVNGADILQFTDYPKGAPSIILKYMSLKKIVDSIAVYAKSENRIISGEVFYHQNPDGYYIADYMKLKGGGTKLTVRCDEDEQIKYQPDKVWAQYRDTSQTVMKFDMSVGLLQQLQSLSGLDKQNAIVFDCKADGLIIKSKDIDDEGIWEVQYDHGNYIFTADEPMKINTSKAILDDILDKGTFYTVHICRNADPGGNVVHTIVYYHDEKAIVVTSVNVE